MLRHHVVLLCCISDYSANIPLGRFSNNIMYLTTYVLPLAASIITQWVDIMLSDYGIKLYIMRY